MTKVQVRFRLQKPLDDATLARIADASTIYGIQKLKVAPSLDAILVEYDASRLRPAEVEAALAGAGIPVERTAVG
jgi:hypothetical protein